MHSWIISTNMAEVIKQIKYNVNHIHKPLPQTNEALPEKLYAQPLNKLT